MFKTYNIFNEKPTSQCRWNGAKQVSWEKKNEVDLMSRLDSNNQEQNGENILRLSVRVNIFLDTLHVLAFLERANVLVMIIKDMNR